MVAPLEVVLQRMEVLDEMQRMQDPWGRQRKEALDDKVQDGLTFARRFRTEIEDCRKDAERGLERQLASAGQGSITLDFAKVWEDVHRCRNGILIGLPEGGDRIWLQNCFAGMREYQTLEFSAAEAPDHSGRRIVAVRDPASGKQVGWLRGEGRGRPPLEKRIFERMGLPVTPPPPPPTGLEADPFGPQ